MKNIYVSPTPQSSNLLLCLKDYTEHENTPAENSDKKGKFSLGFGKYANKEFYQHQNIYITSDEDIKEGNWIYLKGLNKIIHCINIIDGLLEAQKGKKIILTTDQELIKDGVQAIDDKFLDWFVKNPSCDKVEIKTRGGRYSYDIGGNVWIPLNYKIIIPKEEFKQSFILLKNYCHCTDECMHYLSKQCKQLKEETEHLLSTEANKERLLGSIEHFKCCGAFYGCDKCEIKREFVNNASKWSLEDFEDSKYIAGIDSYDKQETLEEAALEYAKNDETKSYDFTTSTLTDAFEEGARWQQERNEESLIEATRVSFQLGHDKATKESSYSEEEVLEMFDTFKMHLPFHYEFLVKEQFKKK
tara:strand:- start:6893 stop:7966 length:1074 start_codon:yes stop_codon:yes gene_type:complete